MATLYWLRLPEHTDMFTQGYVGVAKDMAKRLRSHKHRFKDFWQQIIVEPLVISTQNYCFDLEEKLRPMRNIGWNKSIGGKSNNVMLAEQNPNYGKFGEQAPNFKGLWTTPLGTFETLKDAAKLHGVDTMTIQRRCIGRYANGKFYAPKQGYAFEQKDRVASQPSLIKIPQRKLADSITRFWRVSWSGTNKHSGTLHLKRLQAKTLICLA